MSDVFTLERYSEKPTFSSFLPGIAGEAGIPAWCYYNNRGQAVCSFGVSDKDVGVSNAVSKAVAESLMTLGRDVTFMWSDPDAEDAQRESTSSYYRRTDPTYAE